MSNLSVSANQKRKTSLLSVSFLAWSFVLLCRPQDYLSFLEPLRPGLVLGLLTLCIWFFNTNNAAGKGPVEKQVKLYSYLLLIMVLSLPFSYYKSASLKELFHYSTVVLFVFLFYKLMTSAEKIQKMLFVYCVGIATYGLSVLTQGSLKEGRISFGTMFDPNDIAFYMISFITFNLFYISRDNSRVVRLISMASFMLGLLIVIKTGSRGGFVALMVLLTYFLLKRSATFNLSVLQKGALVLLAIISLQFIDFDRERYRSIVDYKDDYNMTSEEGRIAIWKRGMKLMATHPLTGVGFNRFSEGLGRDRESRGLGSAKWQTAHNSLVQIGAETGIFGFILFLVLSFNAYRIFSKTAKEASGAGLAKLGELAQAGFIGHFVAAMFLSQAYSVYWAFYITLSAVLSRLRAEEVQTVRFDSESLNPCPATEIVSGRNVCRT
ncbi:MAG: O-antigen ligase family protein [Desulfuromonadaceae bacterium]